MDVNKNVDLTDCDREPIHILGAIQPFACILAVNEDWVIQHVSENTEQYLYIPPAQLLGQHIGQTFRTDTIHDLKSALQVAKMTSNTERLINKPALIDFDDEFDITVHFNGELIVIEFEQCSSADGFHAANIARQLMSQFGTYQGLDDLLHKAVKQIRMLTGYSRVMAYKFLEDDSGEVVAEAKTTRLESYLGLRYPASDIPKQARQLYLKQMMRIISSVEDERIPILSSSESLPPLDLSLAVSRAVSPIHIQYLKNMGVNASMSLSIVVDGKLWGLIACHHTYEKNLSFELRTVLEFLVETLSLKISDQSRSEYIKYDQIARATYDQILASIQLKPTSFDGIKKELPLLSKVINCDGVGLWLDNHYDYFGQAFDRENATLLVNKLNEMPNEPTITSNNVSEFMGVEFVDKINVAGALAISLSGESNNYLIFYRRPVTQTVTWAGNPNKSVSKDGNSRLQPRASFADWQETHHDKSTQWSTQDVNLAKSLRIALLELLIKQMHDKDKLKAQSIEKQDTLISELNHRVHNILSLMRAIISLSDEAASSKEEFKELLDGRVKAMAFAHDQLTNANWSSVNLAVLLKNEAQAYTAKNQRIFLNGPDLSLEASSVSCLALVMHEMFTNAAKYGALSNLNGQLHVNWDIDKSGQLVIEWLESKGPDVTKPKRTGFGSTIITRSIPYELKGTANLSFNKGGLNAKFVVPSQYVILNAPLSDTKDDTSQQKNKTIQRHKALLVEDNFIIALDAEQILLKLGFNEVEVCGNLQDAMEFLEYTSPDFAILDYNLGGETSEAVAIELHERQVPFMFATGYGNKLDLPAELPDNLPIIVKPYNFDLIKEQLETMG